ncbi:hypothetical protein BX600DRAFT_470469 [Xylariales sp. PMI_506]|nr:hypothetical protein BX600DRAFT_470469 [Xylariales sp. PMI_506]
MEEPQTTIPAGSWILITGATGYIATNTAKEFFARGYKVRGTVRSLEKARFVTDEIFPEEAKRGDLELVEVPDITVPHAFVDAIKGVSAVIHSAYVASFSADPKASIPNSVAGATGLLRTAIDEPSVKEFVYTSSGSAAATVGLGDTDSVGRETYNDAAVAVAWAPPPYTPDRVVYVYVAGKVATEKACWEFVQESKPHFNFNIVSPYTCWGTTLHPSHLTNSSSPSWIAQLYRGDLSRIQYIAPGNYINVRDVALLHLAAVLDPDVSGERIQVWSKPCNWNSVLSALRGLYPDKDFIGDLKDVFGIHSLRATTDSTLPRRLLKKWSGRDDWISLVQGLSETLQYIDQV